MVRAPPAAAGRLHSKGAAPDSDGDVARTVHEVTSELRDWYPGTPSVWAAHIYAGV
nr:hypothetical protein Ade03nite_26550 [Actinoplanes derwentensis]